MEARFKPRFLKDLKRVRKDAEVLTALAHIISQVKQADGIAEVANIKKLVRYRSRYRVKLHLDKRRDFRVGLYVKGNTVWFARLLHRRRIYEENW
jgi:hypothetical protein